MRGTLPEVTVKEVVAVLGEMTPPIIATRAQREARAREWLGKCPTLHPEFVPGVEAGRTSMAHGERNSSTRAPKTAVENHHGAINSTTEQFRRGCIHHRRHGHDHNGRVAVNDTSPSCGGNDLRPWWMVQVVRRMDNGCGVAVGAGKNRARFGNARVAEGDAWAERISKRRKGRSRREAKANADVDLGSSGVVIGEAVTRANASVG